MREGKKIILFLLSLFIALLVHNQNIDAKDTALSEEAQMCLGCHGKNNIKANFQNNESVAAYVDAEKFKASVHNFLTCSGCHDDFSIDKHPERRFRSKEQFKVVSSLVCQRCHKNEQIIANPIHNILLKEEKEGKPRICANCHSAHSIMRVGKKTYKNEEQYCLKCHNNNMRIEFKNGETSSLRIDTSLLNNSVHNRLSCSDCHFGFSSEEHPVRRFKTKRDYSVATSEICRRCHFDKYTRTLEGIHYNLLTQGNLKAPVCTDCHGAHSVYSGRKEKLANAKKCEQCHSEIYNTYSKSVHGGALISEHNEDVPVCSDCHSAHDITDPRTLDFRNTVPQICGNCHANKAIVGKYGLSTDVVRTYLSDFHGVTLGFYKKQRETLTKPTRSIAVCTDCHGTHNISSMRGVSLSVIKANMAKRCEQCHKDATGNFPDAWLSHYEPSLKKASIVFIINRAYEVLMPIMLIGLLLQILLHVWRYAINR